MNEKNKIYDELNKTIETAFDNAKKILESEEGKKFKESIENSIKLTMNIVIFDDKADLSKERIYLRILSNLLYDIEKDLLKNAEA